MAYYSLFAVSSLAVQGGCHRLNESVGHSVLRNQSVFELVSWLFAENSFSRGEGTVNSVF